MLLNTWTRTDSNVVGQGSPTDRPIRWLQRHSSVRLPFDTPDVLPAVRPAKPHVEPHVTSVRHSRAVPAPVPWELEQPCYASRHAATTRKLGDSADGASERWWVWHADSRRRVHASAGCSGTSAIRPWLLPRIGLTAPSPLSIDTVPFDTTLYHYNNDHYSPLRRRCNLCSLCVWIPPSKSSKFMFEPLHPGIEGWENFVYLFSTCKHLFCQRC